MVRRCYVPDCSSEEGKEEHQGVTFHKIPMHPDIRPKWMLLCRIPDDKKDMKVIYVCSRHFLNADFCHFKGKKYMLKQGVLPSVFPWKKAVLKKTKSQKGGSSSPSCAESDDNHLKAVVNDNKGDEVSIKTQPTLSITDNLSSNMSSIVSSGTTNQSEKQQEKIKAFIPNMHIEALDFNEVWYPAQIVEVDYEESEVLIHFEKYSSKYDEWISMNSSRLRPLQKKETEKFSVGEKCLASWSDARKFPATVTKVLNNGVYEVKFDDGFVKSLKVHRMVKVDGKHLQSSPLFDPIQSTKQERRDRKRKLNVAALFGKRSKILDASTSDESVPQIEDADIWVPKWENGKPVGEESSIELNDGARKSVIVPDPRLPPNWVKHLTQRPHGTSAGKWDTVIVNPEGKRFRTRSEVKTWLETHRDYNLTAYTFDFSLHKKTKRSAQTRETPLNQTIIENAVTSTEEHDPAVLQQNEAKNNLKIPSVDGVYQCPISGCDKSFRRENLAQMHVKHYHPEYTKYLDSTPNVADLAYARTVGENLTERVEKLKQVPIRNQALKNTPSKISGSAPTQSTRNDADPSFFPSDADNENKMKIKEETLSVLKDSEILKLLNTKPSVGSVAIKYPPGLPPNAYPDIKLKDLLKKSDAVPVNVNDSSSASSSSSSSSSSTNTNRSAGIKTLLPIVKCENIKKESDNNCENNQTESFDANESHLSELLPAGDYKEQCPEDTVSVQPSESNYIVEGGEVIKIVQMRREEIINCTCGITEEDGLMIQCELCLCWQHAYCNNIEKENQVPDKYVCYICQNSTRSRTSRVYYHDQDWLKHGILTVGSYHCKDDEMLFKRFEKLNKSHDYSGALIELKSYIHALGIKIKIAEAKNHPKLYLWSKPWLKCLLSEEVNKKEETRCLPGQDEKGVGDLCHMQNNIKDKNNEIVSSPFEYLTNSSVLLSLLKSNKKDEPLTTDNILDLDVAKIPQPEAAIDSSECRLNLLDHINFGQNLVETRLDLLEEKMKYFDVAGDNEEQNHVHICHTIKMLLRDLLLLQDFAQSSSL